MDETPARGRRRRRWRWGVALSVLGGLAGAATLLPWFRFPDPGGPYAIGTVTYHWVDRLRSEMFAPETGDSRELMVQVWYPARQTTASERARYLPEGDGTTRALERIFGLPRFALLALAAVRTNAMVDAPIADADPFPVLLFLEGLGGFRQMNTFQVEHLVSRGYVVVALDQPYTAASVAFPDGRSAAMASLDLVRPLVRQSYLPAATTPVMAGRPLPNGVVPYLAEDVTFVLDEIARRDRDGTLGVLSGRLDLERVGAFGTSLGGLVVGEAARTDPRLKALLVLDAAVTTRTTEAGLDQPTMWITRPAETMREERARLGGWSEAEIEAHHTSVRTTFAGLRAPGWFIQVPRTSHLDFTDVPLYSPVFGWVGATGPMDGSRAHRIVNDYGLAFFDRHLRGRPSPLLDGRSHPYPDVQVERHAPPTTQSGERR